MKFKNLLEQTLSNDSQIRRKAEAAIEDLRDNAPYFLIGTLRSQLDFRSEENYEMELVAAVLFKNTMFNCWNNTVSKKQLN